MELQLFALRSSEDYGRKISKILGIPLGKHEEREFEDGEHKIRPLENVRGRDVFVVHSLYTDNHESVNDKLCRLLFFIGALKDASARQVTAVIPYFAYSRKDRKTKARDPITMKYVACILEAAGTDQIMTLDIHNVAAFQNSFRIPTEHLEGAVLFAPYLSLLTEDDEVVVVSPDAGGIKRAERLQTILADLAHKKIHLAFIHKQRSEGIVRGGHTVVGDVQGKTTIIIDDIIASGSTINLAAQALHKAGASRIIACASHALFVGNTEEIIDNPILERILIADTIAPFRMNKEQLEKKIQIIDSSVLFAKAMKRSQAGDSLVELLEHYPHFQPEQLWQG
jgi:ribose-phosphate pyrophosphokinase